MDPVTMQRQIDFRADDFNIDNDGRRVRLSFSSETPYLRGGFFDEPWEEVLGHEDGEVDMERLNNGAVVLYNHRGPRIGVVERAWLENGKGYAEIRFSNRDEDGVQGIWQDVRDGILTNVSVAYRINHKKLVEERENGPNQYRVDRWEPLEISLVDIPADPTVGVGRSIEIERQRLIDPSLTSTNQKEKTMDKETVAAETVETVAPAADESREATYNEGYQKALADEQTRIRELDALFEGHSEYADLHTELMRDSSITVEEASKRLLKAIGAKQEPTVSHNTPARSVEVMAEDADKFARAAEDAIAVRTGIESDASKGSELCGYTLLEMARGCLERRGVRTNGLDKRELVARAFTHSSSDFPKLLENNARKALLRGYEEAPEVFSRFTRAGNLADFKPHTRTGLGSFDSLDKVSDGGEYKYATMGEHGETIQLATYGKLFAITRQAIINDDLDAFTMIPRKMGLAAARTVGDLVFSILTANPKLADGKALFHADHKNLAASGTAITAASVGKGRTAMRTQKDGKATANIRPSFMLVPAGLEDTANVLMASQTDPSQANPGVVNPRRMDPLEVISDARLDTASATAWYLAADPSIYDTIEVGYLDGIAAPFLDSKSGWGVDGREYKARIDAAAAPMGFRGMYKDPGA